MKTINIPNMMPLEQIALREEAQKLIINSSDQEIKRQAESVIDFIDRILDIKIWGTI